ncbi:MAG: lysophospholipase [Helicobacteraceae bacterium]|jgi:fermentation-respiration switch protein FrsA (DUF1100 family)|nr:lysophospholipase [Helicobacteraceae bacterium]
MRLFCLSIISFSLSGCASFFFHPDKIVRADPSFFEVDYETRTVETKDGQKLYAWYLKAENPRALILFFHGNAGNVSEHLPNVYWLPKRGFSVLAIDYRGYGASSGKPSVEGLITDVQAAIEYALNEFDDVAVVIFAQSLGGAAALTASSPYKDKIAALITEGAFSSYETIAKEVAKRSFLGYFVLPFLGGVVDKKYDPIENIAALEGLPILIIHGDRDPIIAPNHARALFDAAKEPKELKIIFNGGHIGSFATDRERRDRFAEIIDALIDKR